MQHTVVELEVVGGLGRPQPHGVDSVVLVARHRGVIWHGQHHLAKGETVRIKSARDMVPSPGFPSLTRSSVLPPRQGATYSSSSGFSPP